MDIVVAVDLNWGIGANGTQTVVIPEDRKHFRELTKDSTVILGKRTLMDFPGGKPLKNRRNIILTRDNVFSVPNGETAHSVDEAVELCKNDRKIFIIGGASVYEQFLPLCKFAYVTKLYVPSPADRFFPNLDTAPNWRLASPENKMLSGDVPFAFLTYENLSVK